MYSIQITLQQLNRILRKLGLFCRKLVQSRQNCNLDLHRLATEGYNRNLGKKKLFAERETVRIAMISLDLEGMTARPRYRLYGRVYNARGSIMYGIETITIRLIRSN